MLPFCILLYLLCNCGCNSCISYNNLNNCCSNADRKPCQKNGSKKDNDCQIKCNHKDFDDECGCIAPPPFSLPPIDKGCGCEDSCIQPRGFI